MDQVWWDALLVKKWSEMLRAQSKRHPLTQAEKDRLALHVRDRIVEWCEARPLGWHERP